MLAGGNSALRRAATLHLGTGQRGLRSQQHRLGRGTRHQPLSGTRHGALPLHGIQVGDATLFLCRIDGQVATRDFGQQIKAPGFALDGQGVYPALRQHTSGVQLAAAFKHRRQCQTEFGALQAGAGGFLVKDVEPEGLLRAIEVLAAVGRGRTNAEIARELFITYATVKSHVSHLLTKLDARDRTQLVVLAHEFGLLG